ncbi:hypothetical protein COLO4_08523 [Corchorus olitorius]|uniref:Uncharacterized protein n=1 Tax=Corchorus olitorius TaxID=93759 RepID=A0A1R3KFG5_9ROSI|nr:hypothetical protein COLO4_08523 [Corchorus olitorius]
MASKGRAHDLKNEAQRKETREMFAMIRKHSLRTNDGRWQLLYSGAISGD